MAEPRWLDDDEQRAWRSFLVATRLLFERLDRELQADAGIPHTYYEILVRLSEAPDRTIRMSALANRSQSSRSRLSHAVARLEERGWVRRERSRDDLRGNLAVLTDEGMAVVEAVAPGHVAAVRRFLFDVITPEQRQVLDEVFSKVLAALQEAGIDCSEAEQRMGSAAAG